MALNKITQEQNKKCGIFLLVNILTMTVCIILYKSYNYNSYNLQPEFLPKIFIPFEHGPFHNIKYKHSSNLIIRHIASQKNETKRVLFFGFTRRVAQRNKCSAECLYESNVADTENYHAVIFAPRSQKKAQNKVSFPKYHDPNQYWVLFHADNAFNVHYEEMKEYLGSFNLTMTWRSDSDVPIGYGYVEKLKSPRVIEPMSSILATKTSLVAWVVSNCNSRGRREIYVRELQKFIPVDIYGKCSNMTCQNRYNYSCWDDIQRKYKFYLAFENSICSGYVTEKTFRTLEMNMVPIVLGGAVYKSILPQMSYINILDFRSPRELAHYLEKLDNDDLLYSQYFQWKTSYTVHRTEDYLSRAFCKLCHILHDPQHPHQEYKDVEKWMKYGCDNQLMSRMYSQWN